ncbi:thiopurine S-methyltransferase [uncultured Roseibium sp.]|uniref:thiopurine S-methyltransferase n=1 Tax=uncultured Roseibium sp. TaxID=1936171 RepID=UPI0026390B68|nr:thiopurine S-methyltransferase [uncultured Roseibium sp.]
MEKAFWQQRWQEGKIGFHEGAPNRHLSEHFDALGQMPGAHVFVPLCGKAVDLDWLLARGLRVSGAEINVDAVEAVFDRFEVTPDITQYSALVRYSKGNLTLWAGDLFELTADDLGSVDAVYDRAALVALPPQMRTAYVTHLRRLCPQVPRLLVTYDYDQSQMDGPPFSVPENEIRSLFEDGFSIEHLASVPISGPLAERCSGKEHAWLLQPPGS